MRIRPAPLSGRSPTPSVEPVKTLLVCRPDFYAIRYTINPWMQLSNPSHHPTALEQWSLLTDCFRECGAALSYVTPRPDLPDMVFTANAGLLLKRSNIFILANFKHEERRPEAWWFEQFFLQRGVQVRVPRSPFEGAGDALFLGRTLVVGHGFRSDAGCYAEIAPLLETEPAVVKLVDRHFYHLDTCFCPLADMDYLIYPGAFEERGLAAIRRLGGREIAVEEGEARRFACNAVQIGRTVILPKGCPRAMQALHAAGYATVATDMSEFLKSGGACKCMTLEI